MSDEPNTLEQISAGRKRAETWLRETQDYLESVREYLEKRTFSRKWARKKIDTLACLADEGSIWIKDLDSCLTKASQLSPSQLRDLEPKFSRARPILTSASSVRDQVTVTYKDIISLSMLLRDHIDAKVAHARRTCIGVSLLSLSIPGLLWCGPISFQISPLLGLFVTGAGVASWRFTGPALWRSLNTPGDVGPAIPFADIGQRAEVQVVRIVGYLTRSVRHSRFYRVSRFRKLRATEQHDRRPIAGIRASVRIRSTGAGRRIGRR